MNISLVFAATKGKGWMEKALRMRLASSIAKELFLELAGRYSALTNELDLDERLSVTSMCLKDGVSSRKSIGNAQSSHVAIMISIGTVKSSPFQIPVFYKEATSRGEKRCIRIVWVTVVGALKAVVDADEAAACNIVCRHTWQMKIPNESRFINFKTRLKHRSSHEALGRRIS
jgi:hypothetical protein